METLLAIVVGGLYAAGFYIITRRHALRLVVGMVLLGHAVNLLILVAGGLTRARPPLVPEDLYAPEFPVANPLTQAMILTAVVIGMGVQVFMLVLVRNVVRAMKTADLAEMDTTEREG
jgi:multicomponent Na+:H+ antiporter subunit C